MRAGTRNAVASGVRAPDARAEAGHDVQRQVISRKRRTVQPWRAAVAAASQTPVGLAAASQAPMGLAAVADVLSALAQPTVMTMIPPGTCHLYADAQPLSAVDMNRGISPRRSQFVTCSCMRLKSTPRKSGQIG